MNKRPLLSLVAVCVVVIGILTYVCWCKTSINNKTTIKTEQTTQDYYLDVDDVLDENKKYEETKTYVPIEKNK